MKRTPFLGHQVYSPLHDRFIKLHVRDAVHQQAAYSIRTFEDGDPVTGLVKLGGACKPRRARPDHGYFLADSDARRFGYDPPFFKAAVDDGILDCLDRDGRLIDAQHTRSFAGGGTHAAGELGKVVGLLQPVQGFTPLSAVDEVIPLWNQIIDRATRSHARRLACRCGRRELRSPCSGLPVPVVFPPACACGTRASR